MTPEPVASADARPRLRRFLEASENGRAIVIQDTRRIGRPIGLSPWGFEIARRLDGQRTLRQIQADLTTLTGGALAPLEAIQQLVNSLDEAMLLDSPRIQTLLKEPIRKPTHIPLGVDAAALTRQIQWLFTADGGAGLPGAPGIRTDDSERLRAVLLPHMDYGRGSITYGHGFKELIEKNRARVFVIIATSHYSVDRFILSRQHFDTPFGLVETDHAYVDQIAENYGDGLYDDREAHVPEHSIELEVTPLKHLMGDVPFKIVPLLVGSFRDCIQTGSSPTEAEDVARMVRVLREVEASYPEPVCYIISGDLAHIGPKFRDQRKAAGPWLVESRAKDEAILKTLESASPGAYFDVIAEEGDRRRICGLSPTWLTLEVAKPRTGRVLHYQQFIDPNGHESVSFASAAFYG